MSIEERNRIVLLERRMEQLEAVVSRLIDQRLQAEQAKTIKLPEQKRA